MAFFTKMVKCFITLWLALANVDMTPVQALVIKTTSYSKDNIYERNSGGRIISIPEDIRPRHRPLKRFLAI